MMMNLSNGKERTTMPQIRTLLLAAALALVAVPALAQEPDERLERLRLERMQQALELSAEQAQAVSQSMDELRRAMEESRRREREAMEEMRSALRDEPVDQGELQESIAAIEREREAAVRAHREQAERLRQQLNVEQQAKLMLFNREFDTRLRELVRQRGGAPRPGMAPGPGRGRPGVAPRPNRGPGVTRGAPMREPRTREEQIAHLQQQISRLQQRLTELQSQD
jgi:septal ring factor EnvC (AmiA/AmiB activator)